MSAQSRKAEQLIAALLSSKSIEEAAAKVGIAAVTARRWRQEEKFQEQFQRVKQDVMSQATGQLQAASIEAISTLREIQTDGKTESSRVSAARTILDNAFRSVELEEIQRRLERLEAAASDKS